MGVTGKVLGSVAVVSGVIAAAALGGMTAQRAALHRYREFDQLPGGAPAGGFAGQQADRAYSVVAPDGVALHVEEVGPADAPLTVIFSHGWTLQLAAWSLQRAAFAPQPSGDVRLARDAGDAEPSRDLVAARPAKSQQVQGLPALRLVFYDQRSHGRSGRAPSGHYRLADLADDLAAVIATAAAEGPVVLVGHSMGGMAILTLALRDPQLFAARVRAVALISTSASEETSGLAGFAQINGANPVLNWAMAIAGRYPRPVERARIASHDAVWLATRALGFADPAVPAPLVDALDEMISATPIDVIAQFAPALFRHDETAALPVLATMPVLIAVGDQDRMTPPARSVAMAAALPEAELLVLPGSGHMVTMERAAEINAALARLIRAAATDESRTEDNR